MTRLGTAAHFLGQVLDPGTFESWDEPVVPRGDNDYLASLARARSATGVDEAVLTGRGRIEGTGVALLVSEFGFLGGSIGVNTADRLTRAIRLATERGLPIVAAPASGGTRMQEGTRAFVKMAEVARAVEQHKSSGLPYLVYLRHPTTGGVFASWGSLGQLTFAEPGALLGFLGPKVYRAVHGEDFPEGVQIAENLARNGIVDRIVPLPALRGLLATVLGHLHGGPASEGSSPAPTGVVGRLSGAGSAWQSIQLTRRPDRPGVEELLRHAAGDTVELGGSGAGVLVALTRLAGTRCVVVGHRRHPAPGPIGPTALRAARRGVILAEQFGLPLVTVIDTPGAELSAEAEEDALAGEIARCLATLTGVRVPTAAILLGQGCGGAALALTSAHTVVAAEHAWLSPLPLEGASAIVHGHPRLAADMATAQRVVAADLLADGIVDVLVGEHRLASGDVAGFCRDIATSAIAAISSQNVRS
ncbi:carboxyl transferase domain-containing protein [Saccharomonospora xinjiangensis]|uniref:Acetyl-CoA carboxylase beta subunit n=1 Tax=Saccharomonospora xinjiangensis XJ-54 TaxID=882086 RepID=I0V7A3_9PSEU|nr:carboxyl transferase domain-containing protein [Saccharomonospora xinjiangensis]EID56006.1 acetyl-CoA carboxylase beta subunit [Saccharomonospora xinjiangensis XJ-54]